MNDDDLYLGQERKLLKAKPGRIAWQAFKPFIGYYESQGWTYQGEVELEDYKPDIVHVFTRPLKVEV